MPKETYMHERILPRAGAASGALFVILLFAPSSSGSESMLVTVAELLGLLFFILFLAYLCSLLREAEGPGGWLAPTAFGAGLVDVSIKLGSIAPAWASRDFGEATEIHHALDAVNRVAFMATLLPLGVLMAAVALVTLTTHVLPRWLGWFAALTAPLLLVNGMFLDEDFGPAFLLFLLWVLFASVVLIVRPDGDRSQPRRVPSTATGAPVNR